MILVRRNELACRDEWSRSLWQPSSAQERGDVLSHFHPTIAGPVQPTSREHLQALLTRDATTAAPEGEDVLLSEGRIVSEAREVWEPETRPFPAGNFDPRTAIFRAREAYREKVRARAALARNAAGTEALAGSRDQPAAVVEARAPDIESTSIEPWEQFDPLPEEYARILIPASEEQNSNHAGGSVVSVMPGADSSVPPMALDQIMLADEWHSEAGREAVDDRRDFQTEDAEVCLPDEPNTGEDVVPHSESGRLDLDLPEWFRGDLPHVCRACRDFRPAVDGQRGWCANRWAFTHRQLVQEDDVSPCHSAIGDWWVAVDDVWLVAADVSSHGRPTPLLNRLTGEEGAQRRRS